MTKFKYLLMLAFEAFFILAFNLIDYFHFNPETFNTFSVKIFIGLIILFLGFSIWISITRIRYDEYSKNLTPSEDTFFSILETTLESKEVTDSFKKTILHDLLIYFYQRSKCEDYIQYPKFFSTYSYSISEELNFTALCDQIILNYKKKEILINYLKIFPTLSFFIMLYYYFINGFKFNSNIFSGQVAVAFLLFIFMTYFITMPFQEYSHFKSRKLIVFLINTFYFIFISFFENSEQVNPILNYIIHGSLNIMPNVYAFLGYIIIGIGAYIFQISLRKQLLNSIFMGGALEREI